MPTAVVITASYDKQIRFWDATSGRTVRCFPFQDSQINALMLIPSLHALVVAGFGVLRVYDVSGIVSLDGGGSGQGDRNSSSSGTGNADGSAATTAGTTTATAAGGGGSGGQQSGGGGGQGQAPPLLSAFESQGSMNFTSLGTFPLRRCRTEAVGAATAATAAAAVRGHLSGSDNDDSNSDNTDSDSDCNNDDGGSGMFQYALSAFFVSPGNANGTTTNSGGGGSNTSTITGGGGGRHQIGTVLFATSEDGHIRFFDAQSSSSSQSAGGGGPGSALRQIKDIATGAAVTCSCLSPDRRFLLTGSQIGVVSVWHLPSVIASAAIELNGGRAPQQQQQHQSAGANLSPAQAEAFEAAARDTKLYGKKPLQEISFDGDYTAVRSIAIDPHARWAVVATNAGNVHFIRFSGDSHLLGSRSVLVLEAAAARQQPHSGSGGGGGGGMTATTTTTGTTGGSGLPPRMPFGPAQSVPSIDGHSSSLSHGGGGGSSAAGAPSSFPTSSQQQQQRNRAEGVYRSAVVVNEMRNQARRSNTNFDGSGEANSPGSIINSNINGGHDRTASGSSGIGTALLDDMEQQAAAAAAAEVDVEVEAAAAAASGGLPAKAATPPPVARPPPAPTASRLQTDMHMEVFYSFQAHYKYILRVLISPDGAQLVTCSADYTIGRFVIPEWLNKPPPPVVVVPVVTSQSSPRATASPNALMHISQLAEGEKETKDTESHRAVGDSPGAATTPVVRTAAAHLNTSLKSDVLPPSINDDTASPSFDNTATDAFMAANAAATAAAAATSSRATATDPGSSGSGADLEDGGTIVGDDITPLNATAAPAAARSPPMTTASAMTPPAALAAATDADSRSTAPGSMDSNSNDGGGAPSSVDTQQQQQSAAAAAAAAMAAGCGGGGTASTTLQPQHCQFKPLKPLTGHTRWVWDCAFSDCCRFLFSCGSDAQVRMWNGLTSDRPQSTAFPGHTKPVVAILFCYDRSK